jgi:hypothetical protein
MREGVPREFQLEHADKGTASAGFATSDLPNALKSAPWSHSWCLRSVGEGQNICNLRLDDPFSSAASNLIYPQAVWNLIHDEGQ